MNQKRCQFCREDWSMYSDDPNASVLGFKLRGLYFCCPEQMRYWVKVKSRLSDENKARVLSELGLS